MIRSTSARDPEAGGSWSKVPLGASNRRLTPGPPAARGRARPGTGWWPARGRRWWPGRTTVSSSRVRNREASEASISGVDPPGRSVRPIEPANTRSPARSRAGSSPSAAEWKVTWPGVCPGVWSTRRRRPAEGGPGLGAEAGQGVGEQVAVGRVDEGRDVAGPGQGGDGPDVVEVAVGEQGGHRLEAVAGAQLVDATQGVLAGVDDQRLRARRGRDQPAVRLEGPGGKSGHEHGPHATGTGA